jgi:tetratricopeptide (TPR) repeat protein
VTRITRFLLALLVAAGSSGALAGTAAEHLADADRFWAENRLDAAQAAFESAVSAEPDSIAARMRLAGFQLARQQTTACIENYHKVLSREPKNSRAWIGLGLAYLHSGRQSLARAAFEEAVGADPTRAEALAPLIARLEAKG